MMNRRDFIKSAAAAAGVLLSPLHGHAIAQTDAAGEGAQSPGRNPFLIGGFAPVRDEVTIENLPVRGQIPRDIVGVYMRNGPNPAYPPISYFYPFDGDGMIHALYFENGRVSYRNRFVNTAGLKAERRAGRAIYGGLFKPIPPDPAFVAPDGDPSPFKKVANTHVIRHAGRYLALREDDLPYEVTRELETVGKWDFYGAVRDTVTAHPKIDAATGELFMFRYSARPPYLVLRVVDPSGRLVRQEPLDLPAAFVVHDMAITTNHVLLFLCPFVMEPEKATRGEPFFNWQPERGTRIAVVRRDGTGQTLWFATEAFFMFHFMNAHETESGIVTEYCQFPSLPSVGNLPALWRMTLDFKTGNARRQQVDERPGEFPRVDSRIWGRPYRYGWLPVVTQKKRAPGTWSALARYDFKTGAIATHDFGPGREVDEPVFVARSGRKDEGDGWIMTYVYDAATDRSTFVILDARESERAPIAEIALSRRVPHGFHGDWMPAESPHAM
jgi:carotenoid cleavage dioxygenase-like enzyme